jgi:hypothetical protein
MASLSATGRQTGLHKKTARPAARRFQYAIAWPGRYATFGARFFELRWKNSA